MGEHQRPKAPPQNERIPPREDQPTSVMILYKTGQTAQSYCLRTKKELKYALENDPSAYLIIETGSDDHYTKGAEIIVPKDNIAQIIVSENKPESKIVSVSPLVKLN